MPKSKILRLVPSSGKSLKEISESVDLLFVILGPLLASVLVEHPQIKVKMLTDLQAMRGISRSPKQQATLDKAIRLIDGLFVIEE
jgi:hypothetical protein